MLAKPENNAINIRYSDLAGSDCCLSCGGAINHAEAKIGETCVDLGSGRGHDVIRLAGEVGPSGKVYGIDLSDGMIDKAWSNAKKLGVENVEFIKCELDQIPLQDQSVDLILSNCVINHVANKLEVWNEIYRILKNGGRFVVSDIYAVDPIDKKYRNDPEAIAECWGGASERQVYLDTIYQAGFKNINIIEESKPYEKGKAVVASWTIAALKPKGTCGCRN